MTIVHFFKTGRFSGSAVLSLQYPVDHWPTALHSQFLEDMEGFISVTVK